MPPWPVPPRKAGRVRTLISKAGPVGVLDGPGFAAPQPGLALVSADGWAFYRALVRLYAVVDRRGLSFQILGGQHAQLPDRGRTGFIGKLPIPGGQFA